MQHRAGILLFVVVLATAACGQDATAPAGNPHEVELGSVAALFNPQPEPPAQIYDFMLDGTLLRMEGRTLEEGGGALAVTGLESRTEGTVLHLVQRWEVYPPDPISPVDFVVSGILNLETGLMVLNGRTEEGVPVHVIGTAELSSAGALSIGGELMFNPQPEPPAP